MEPCLGPVRRFSGHKGAVLDISAYKHKASSVITSSEDKTIRLWDLRSQKAQKCFAGFDHPVNVVRYSSSDEHKIFGMTDNSILSFDLRVSGLLSKDAHNTLFSTTEGDAPDLCCFAIHPKEKVNIMAIGDDEGVVSILSLDDGKVIKRLSRVHSNIVGCVEFQPNSKNYVGSGGFDSKFSSWDIARARPSGDVIDFSSGFIQRQEMANPPFVHDFMYMNGGVHVVCAIGDGSLQLLEYQKKTGFVVIDSASDAHGGIATNLCGWSETCLLSAGIDCKIKGWKVSNDFNDDHNEIKNHKSEGKKAATKRYGSTCPKLETLFTINHSEKINSLAFLVGQELAQSMDNSDNSNNSDVTTCNNGAGIAVADVSNTWKLYNFNG